MKKSILVFIICALLILSVTLWMLKGKATGSVQEILMVAGIFILVGFALLFGLKRMRSHARKEPLEDELSKKVMTKATSLAYYISLYLWLFVMYVSDKVKLPVHTLIGAGIMGMALAFFFCWLYLNAAGMKND